MNFSTIIITTVTNINNQASLTLVKLTSNSRLNPHQIININNILLKTSSMKDQLRSSSRCHL
jgi:hypothetical protein